MCSSTLSAKLDKYSLTFSPASLLTLSRFLMSFRALITVSKLLWTLWTTWKMSCTVESTCSVASVTHFNNSFTGFASWNAFLALSTSFLALFRSWVNFVCPTVTLYSASSADFNNVTATATMLHRSFSKHPLTKKVPLVMLFEYAADITRLASYSFKNFPVSSNSYSELVIRSLDSAEIPNTSTKPLASIWVCLVVSSVSTYGPAPSSLLDRYILSTLLASVMGGNCIFATILVGSWMYNCISA